MNDLTVLALAIAHAVDNPLESPLESVEDLAFELNRRRPIVLPPAELRTDPTAVRAHLGDRVTIASLVLSQSRPEEFVFYRQGIVDREVSDSMEWLASLLDIAPTAGPIGRLSFDRYLVFNEACRVLREMCNLSPNALSSLLWGGLVPLFAEPPQDSPGTWMFASATPFESHSGADGIAVWSARRDVQQGDLVFIYETAPTKAVTSLCVVEEAPWFDPYSAWGYWAVLRHVARVSSIPFSAMRTDPVLSQWAVVRKQFQGVTAAPLPPVFYNRFLELLSPDDIRGCGLVPIDTADDQDFSSAIDFTSESDFEDRVIEPLLRDFGLQFERQASCKFAVGRAVIPCRVDFLIRAGSGRASLIESKWRVRSPKDLTNAHRQGLSYARQLAVNRFAVAAPEGVWLYDVNSEHCSSAERLPWNSTTRTDLGTWLRG